jgi:TonB family protein
LLASALAFLSSNCVLHAQNQQETTSEAIYEVGGDVTAPKPVYTPDPEYSEKARKRKINGVVVLSMTVTAEGKVRDVRVVKSLDSDLDKQAIAALRSWRFEPATRAGKPVAVHLKTETAFKLY